MDIQTQDIIDEMQQRFSTELTVCVQAAQLKTLSQINQDIVEAYQEMEKRLEEMSIQLTSTEETLRRREADELAKAVTPPEDFFPPEDGDALSEVVVPFPVTLPPPDPEEADLDPLV